MRIADLSAPDLCVSKIAIAPYPVILVLKANYPAASYICAASEVDSLDIISCDLPSAARLCDNAQTAVPPAPMESRASAVSARRSAVEALDEEEDANPTARSDVAIVCAG